MKCGTVMNIGPVQPMHRWEFLKIQDGGGRHLKKSQNRDISATVWPIFTTRHYASSVYTIAFCLSVRHKSVFC